MGVPQRFLSVAEKLRELGANNVEIAYVWEKTKENEGYLHDDRIHEALKEINPALAERFYRDMRIKVWRTDFRREHFNRRRIVESLQRETGLSRGIAERIAKEVEERIRSTDVSVITSPLIRELVLAKLIEMGMEDEYGRYMRIGIPVFDLERSMDRGDVEEYLISRIMGQYVLFQVLPRETAELVMDGVLTIRGMYRPHLLFAKTFRLKTPRTEKWIGKLVEYLLERDYADTPSVYVPPHMGDDPAVRSIIDALKGHVIFWSDGEVDGVIQSEHPVYSFGAVPSKAVLDIFEVDASAISEHTASLTGIERTVSAVKEGISVYVEFKGKRLKGDYYVIVKNTAKAAEKLATTEEEIMERFSPLKPLKFV